MRRDEVLKVLSEHRAELTDLGVKSLAIFGSVARDETRLDSDVDILIELHKPTGFFEFLEIKERLEEWLGCEVDLGTFRSLKPRLRERVLHEAVDVA